MWWSTRCSPDVLLRPLRLLLLAFTVSLAVACTPNTGLEQMAENTNGELSLQVSTTPVPYPAGQVQLRLVISNPADHTLSVQLSRYCPVGVRIFEEKSRSGVPVWDETKDRACPFVARVVELAPGESETILHPLDVRELRRRGVLRPGRYFLSVHVPWDLRLKILDAGEIMVQGAA